MQGGSEELAQFLPKPIPIKFKLLHGGKATGRRGKFFVTTNPDIKSIEDMKGKRISIGLIGQSDWGVFPYLLLKYVYGIDETNSDIRRLNPGGLTQQLIDGTTDVAVTGYGTDPDQQHHLNQRPVAQAGRLGQGSALPRHHPGGDRQAEREVRHHVRRADHRGGGPCRARMPTSSPASTAGYKAAHPDFPEELAYQFVTAAYKYAGEMRKLNALGAIMTDRMMLDGLTEENAHPGAIRAFKELGVWDARMGSVPVTYPQ